MLMPKKSKYRKQQRNCGGMKGKATRGNKISFGSYGLKAEGRNLITANQIEAARRAITKCLARGGKLWVRIFPDKPITLKGIEVRMGKGKGAVDRYVAPIKPGRVLFELDGVSDEIAKEAFRLAAYKLPLKTRVIKK